MKFQTIQQEIFAKRAGLTQEEKSQINEEWQNILNESQEFDPSDVIFALNLLEELEEIVEALPKAAYVSAMRNATDYDNENGRDPEKVVARAKKHHGDKFAKDLESGADKMHYPRKGHTSGFDNLALRDKPRVTASGKAHKQSVQKLKNAIKNR
jgi:hypothetical protein